MYTPMDFTEGPPSGYPIKRLIDAKWLSKKKKATNIDDLVNELLHGSNNSGQAILQDTQITGLLEFGRSVHAEMAALMDATRRGATVKGSTLYSTTFPCHICARHIIAAGIDRVVYIEPYPKSATEELYHDSVAVDEPSTVSDRVRFESFVGIAPIRYLALFGMHGKRKENSGKRVEWVKSNSSPKITRYALSYLLIEEGIMGNFLPQLLKKKGIKYIKNEWLDFQIGGGATKSLNQRPKWLKLY